MSWSQPPPFLEIMRFATDHGYKRCCHNRMRIKQLVQEGDLEKAQKIVASGFLIDYEVEGLKCFIKAARHLYDGRPLEAFRIAPDDLSEIRILIAIGLRQGMRKEELVSVLPRTLDVGSGAGPGRGLVKIVSIDRIIDEEIKELPV